MSAIVLETFLLSLLGGVLSLDRTAAFQFMVSRPIVVSTVIGLLFRDLTTGLLIGVMTELLWMGELPIGASLPPDETAFAIVVSSVTFIGERFVGGISRGYVVSVILLSLPVAWFFRKIDERIRVFNSRISRDAIHRLSEGRDDAVDRAVLKGLLSFFVPSLLFLWFFMVLGVYLIIRIYPLLSNEMVNMLGEFFYIFPIIGIASVLSSFKRLKSPLLLFSIFYGLMVIILA